VQCVNSMAPAFKNFKYSILAEIDVKALESQVHTLGAWESLLKLHPEDT